jgi:(2R)-ethylmalonyl-CoA mutase
MEISYEGIRLTPDELIDAARTNEPHVIGLSILSGAHVALTRSFMLKLQTAGLGHIPVVAGGIIPDEDAKELKQLGVAKI